MRLLFLRLSKLLKDVSYENNPRQTFLSAYAKLEHLEVKHRKKCLLRDLFENE